jgi:hypothetical protein
VDLRCEEPALNADHAAQLRLLDLQDLDSHAAQLRHRRATLPELATLADLATRHEELQDRLVAAQTESGDVARLVAKAEADVEQVRQRAARDRQRLESGATSAKDLQSLTAELESLARRQSELEDAELEVMQRQEDVDAAVAGLTAELAAVVADEQEVSARRDAAFAEIDAASADLAADRGGIVAAIPSDLLALYEKLRDQYGGIGAAALENGRCLGCRLELTPADRDRIKAESADAVVRCEECRRILVRR